MNGPVTTWGKADPFRWELTNQIFSILSANSTNVRPFYKGCIDLPKGGILQLINETPFDGIRAEVKGTPVDVEIFTKRSGDFTIGEVKRFATYDIESSRTWFYNQLKERGIQPTPVAPVNLLHGDYLPDYYSNSITR